MTKGIFILALCFVLSACHTIIIKNGSDAKTNFNQDEWHQIGILQLVEFSDPVDLSNRCHGRDWTAVRTERSTGQVFLGLVPYLDVFYSPQEFAISCK